MRRNTVGVPQIIVMPMQQISQDELANLQMLWNQREALTRELRAAGQVIYAKLERVAEVEAGSNRAWIEECRNGMKVTRMLVLNGNALGD